MVYRITKRGGGEGEGDSRRQQDDTVMGTRHDTIPLKFLRRAASDSRSEKKRSCSESFFAWQYFQTVFVPADGSS